MPNLIEMNTDVRPTLVLEPNMRFAATYLSNEYRRFSVKGETLQDKQTGEIFTRRPNDGKIVSFFQNKKYMHDLMLELRVLITNNEWMTLPTSGGSFYVAPDYDLMEFNDSKVNDIQSNNTEFNDNALTINLSIESNGFFIRPTTRDTDKAIIEYATNVYDKYVSKYTGLNPLLVAENDRFSEDRWAYSNVILSYDIIVSNSVMTITYSNEEYIRMNEACSIPLPETRIHEDFPDGYDSIVVTIKKLDYHKFHFLLEHIDLFPNMHEIEAGLASLRCPDGKVLAQYMMIQYFIDDISDLTFTNKEVLVALLDMPYVRRYLAKMAKLHDSSTFILATHRPYDDEWTPNSIWAEWFREVGKDGVIIDHDSELDIDTLNEFYARGIYVNTSFSDNLEDTDAIVLTTE